MAGQYARDLVDDTGAVVGHQGQLQGALLRLVCLATDSHLDIDALGAEPVQVNTQCFELVVGDIYPQNAGKLSGHAGHAAFQPIAAVPVDDLSQAFHQTGLVGGYDGNYERGGHA